MYLVPHCGQTDVYAALPFHFMLKVIGDGGHTKVVRDVIAAMTQISGTHFIAVGNNESRKKEAELNAGGYFAVLIHPRAYVAPNAILGEGTIVMAGAVIQPEARIGKHVIVNTGATVDHECLIGDFAHIAPGAHLCGCVEVGEGALVGVGAVAIPGAKIPAWSLVKAGSVAKCKIPIR